MTIIIGFLFFLLGGFIGVLFIFLLQVSSNSDDSILSMNLSKARTQTKIKKSN